MKNSKIRYILLLPFFLVVLLLLTSILYVLYESFFGVFGIKINGDSSFSIESYKIVLSDKIFLNSLLSTFYIAFLSSSISCLIGFLLAIFLYNNNISPDKVWFIRIVILLPYVVIVFIIILWLQQTGFLSRLLYGIGLVNESKDFPLLIFDRGGVGIILTYIYKQAPFVIFSLLTTLCFLERNLLDSAKVLGANTFKVTLYVIFPHILPSLLSCFFIIFAFNFGSFEVPYLLGNTIEKTLPIISYEAMQNPNLEYRRVASAINIIMIFVSLLLLFASFKVSKNYKKVFL